MLAVPGLLVLSPFLLVLALLVRVFLGSPILFRQERPGLNGRHLTLHKFRTMTDARDVAGELLPDAERLTPFGKFLRVSSLDELPELINVIRGEMSLVGPRPLLMRYLPHFTSEERLRFTVLPGITGWAQIHGRNEVTWEHRIQLDLWYVDHCGLALDLRILLSTLIRVVTGSGAHPDANAVMRDLDEVRRAAGGRTCE